MDAVASATVLDVVEVRRRNLVSTFPARDGDRGRVRLRRLRRGAGPGREERRPRRAGAPARDGPGRGRLLRHRQPHSSSTRPAPTSATSAWPPPAEDRQAGRDKSGSTEHVRMSVDLQGIV
ncbi:hypothetical protein [Pseudonocardia sp. ICBG1293]|uniref:hypothetical protein n=1 Tax=Pseudonocardia sp. ICBG1293 TaxID=2844382 RepID=UPI002105696E|nr:hypothetical protein [Pseudonocardia sp. ICBG1293]